MKLAKLSLAAIMAAGALSTANATSLEDAIKGVDLSGYAFVRYHDESGAEAYNKIELRAQLTAPVQENIQFVTRFTASSATKIDDSSTNAANTSSGATPSVDRLFFNYTGFANTTITLGRQYAGTPLDDTAALGLKVVSSPVKGLTLAAAYFNDNSAVSNALEAVAVIYSNDMFNARAWYINMEDEKAAASYVLDPTVPGFTYTAATMVDGASFVFLEVGANVGPVAAKVQYAQKNPDAAGAKTASTIRAQVSGSVGPVALRAGYTTNDKDAGDVRIDKSWDYDNDLINGGIYGLFGKSGSTNGADEDSAFLEATATFGKFSVKAGYVDYNHFNYDNQVYGQVTYQVSKKLVTYVRYGTADSNVLGQDDKTLSRFQAQYNF